MAASIELSPDIRQRTDKLGVRDVGLFEHAVVMRADQKVGDMLLKREFERFPALGNDQGFRG